MVYAGANDGMLHGFNAASTGKAEKLAFIPVAVFNNLPKLTQAELYVNHEYFVDGAPNMGDVFYNGAWHTVLVGGLNKGGQGIYALDITNPGSFSKANGCGSSTMLARWEIRTRTMPIWAIRTAARRS